MLAITLIVLIDLSIIEISKLQYLHIQDVCLPNSRHMLLEDNLMEDRNLPRLYRFYFLLDFIYVLTAC